LTGSTTSTNFPTLNPEQPYLDQSGGANTTPLDSFVTKLDPTGDKLIYSTYLGGSGADNGAAIRVDGKGNAIVAGYTDSQDFPHAGAIPITGCQFNGNCYFLTSLSPDGSQLNYSGIVAGIQAYYGSAGVLALDSTGNAYVSGDIWAENFTVTPGTLSSYLPGYPYSTLFVMKVDPTGKLLYATGILGAPAWGAFVPFSIAVDGSGQVTLAGTASLGLPTTSNVVQPSFPYSTTDEALTAGFVLQLNATASAINFASYLPGTGSADGMAVDSSGDLYFVGATAETSPAVTAKAYEWIADSSYVMELSGGATAVKAAVYFTCCMAGIALDTNRNVFVGGMTMSSTFPMKHPFTPIYEFAMADGDMAVAEFDSGLSTLLFGSYLSSTIAPYPGSTFTSMTVDAQNNLILTGKTMADDFPTTAGSFQPQLPTAEYPLSDVAQATFVSKINLAKPSPMGCLDNYSWNFGNATPGVPLTKTVNLINCGNAPLHLSSITSTEPSFTTSQSCGAIAAGVSCPVTVTFDPLQSGSLESVLEFNDDGAVRVQKAIFTGMGLAPSIQPVANPVMVGHALVGAQSPFSLQLFNDGNFPLAITITAVTGSSFKVPSYSCTYFGGSACPINIVFAPRVVGTNTGSLLLSTNDPVNPRFVVNLSGVGDSVYLTPVIAYLSPGTAPIGTPVSVSVFGTNFYPASVVNVNGTAQPTTYVSNSELQFQLTSSELGAVGQVPIKVVNPSPGGSSNTAFFAPYRALTINPSALAYVPSTGTLYAAIPASAASNPNTVIPVTPATGALGKPITVGNNPVLLAASGDGKYLYVALSTDQTIQRINLATRVVERSFPYPGNTSCRGCALDATGLQVVPNAPQEVVLALGTSLALYNDGGLVNSIVAPLNSILEFNEIAFVGNSNIFGLPLTLEQCAPFDVTLGASGLAYTPPAPTGWPCSQFSGGSALVSSGTLLYDDAGQVWDTTTMTISGTFPVATQAYEMRNIALDPTTPNFYLVGINQSDPNFYLALFSYSTHSLEEIGELTFPGVMDPSISDLIRWGSDGFAFIAPGPGLTDQELYLFRSNLANAQTTNPVPVLSSLSYTFSNPTIYVQTLDVYGSNFVPSSVVQWNGTAVPTAFISSTHLIATLKYPLLANATTAQVTVFTPAPGGGTSSALQFLVGQFEPTATLSATALNFGNVLLGETGGVEYITVSNNGWALLFFSSITTTGDFSSSSTCTSSLTYLDTSGTCEIAVTFSPTTAGQRTGTITITDNAPDSPQAISLTGSGTIGLPLILLLSGSNATEGSGSFTLTLNGAGFVSGSQVLWNGAVRATTYVSSTELTATILASDIAHEGTFLVTVANPAPNAATAAAQPFVVRSSIPVAKITGASIINAADGSRKLLRSSI
jgi:hypothetical protein